MNSSHRCLVTVGFARNLVPPPVNDVKQGAGVTREGSVSDDRRSLDSQRGVDELGNQIVELTKPRAFGHGAFCGAARRAKGRIVPAD